jgi:hypothetical protein
MEETGLIWSGVNYWPEWYGEKTSVSFSYFLEISVLFADHCIAGLYHLSNIMLVRATSFSSASAAPQFAA